MKNYDYTRLKNLVVKASERGIIWMIKRLYQEILIPSTKFEPFFRTTKQKVTKKILNRGKVSHSSKNSILV